METDREARAEFFDAARPFTGHLSVEVRERQFIVATWDQTVGKSLFVKRIRGEFTALARAFKVLERVRRLPRGGTFLDCGANIGTTTVAALERFDRVVAFEPDPENCRLLAANLALNGLSERVELRQVALSDRSGELRMRISARNSGGHEVHPDGDRVVEAATLDELVAQDEPVAMLWLDVQGHEPSVLAGASRFAGVPTVLEVIFPLDDAVRAVLARYEWVFDLSRGEWGVEERAGHTDVLVF